VWIKSDRATYGIVNKNVSTPDSQYSLIRSMHLSAGPTIRPESGIAENSALIWASCSAEWVGASKAVSENRSVEGSRSTEAQACARKSLRCLTFSGGQNRMLIP